MGDIKSPTILWIKGILFLLLALLASALLVVNAPSITVAVLLCIAIWAFCRCYYFAFYVIEHYVDPNYRFAGLLDFIRYAFGKCCREGEINEVQ
jgi:hypothetical protein